MGILLFSFGIKSALLLCFIGLLFFQYFIVKSKHHVFYVLKSLILILFFFELFFYSISKWNGSGDKRVSEVKGDFYVHDSTVGYRLKANLHEVVNEKRVGEREVYRTTNSTDHLGRRICSDQIGSLSQVGQKHLIVAGCSFVFGLGLDCESTLPAILARADTSFRVYNYGTPGYGPHQTVLLFQNGINVLNNDVVREGRGVMIYTFITNHLTRVYGGSKYLQYASETPDVYVVDGVLRHSKRDRFFVWFNKKVINKSETLKFFNITTSYPKTNRFYKRFADIINEMARLYYFEFPNGKFIVAAYPEENPDLAWVKYLNDKLMFVNPPLPHNYLYEKHCYVLDTIFDRHPTKKLNEYVALKLYDAIYSE